MNKLFEAQRTLQTVQTGLDELKALLDRAEAAQGTQAEDLAVLAALKELSGVRYGIDKLAGELLAD